jgi:hypothetical protein
VRFDEAYFDPGFGEKLTVADAGSRYFIESIGRTGKEGAKSLSHLVFPFPLLHRRHPAAERAEEPHSKVRRFRSALSSQVLVKCWKLSMHPHTMSEQLPRIVGERRAKRFGRRNIRWLLLGR